MSEEYIIGRHSSSPLKIPADKNAVSNQHLKIIVSPNGTWTLEDLNSSNGTYIRDDKGEFHRVYKKQIHESDIIRLGNGGANSYTFTAKRVVAPDESYQYEFRKLKNLLAHYKEEEQKREKKMEINGWISKLAGVAIVGICAILGAVSGINIDPNTRYLLIAFAPIVVGLFFSGDKAAMKTLKSQKAKIMLCPHCGKPISEFDVEQGQCSRCKAK